MDLRRIVLVSAVALALAVGLALGLAPDTGPDPVPPLIARPPAPRTPLEDAPIAELHPAVEPPQVRPVLRAPAPPDPATVHPADARGLASAAMSRRPRLVECWEDYLDRVGDAPGRFTVEVTVRPDGEVEAAATNAPDDGPLADCVQQAMDDARFERPEEGSVSVLVPVPLPAPE